MEVLPQESWTPLRVRGSRSVGPMSRGVETGPCAMRYAAKPLQLGDPTTLNLFIQSTFASGLP